METFYPPKDTEAASGDAEEESTNALPDACARIIESVPEAYRGQRRLRYLAEKTSELSAETENRP